MIVRITPYGRAWIQSSRAAAVHRVDSNHTVIHKQGLNGDAWICNDCGWYEEILRAHFTRAMGDA